MAKPARENVVREIGLFQGRLGFNRAIILLEAGCSRFSNIDGPTYIPFAKGDMRTAWEEIRKVLEREGLVRKCRRSLDVDARTIQTANRVPRRFVQSPGFGPRSNECCEPNASVFSMSCRLSYGRF